AGKRWCIDRNVKLKCLRIKQLPRHEFRQALGHRLLRALVPQHLQRSKCRKLIDSAGKRRWRAYVERGRHFGRERFLFPIVAIMRARLQRTELWAWCR